MNYNPFKQLHENTSTVYSMSFKERAAFSFDILAGHFPSNVSEAVLLTVGILDYLFILPALAKIAWYYSTDNTVLKIGLGYLNFLWSKVALFIASIVTLALSPLLYVVHTLFAVKAYLLQNELLELEILPVHKDNKKYIVHHPEAKSLVSRYSIRKDLSLREFVPMKMKKVQTITQEIRRGNMQCIKIYPVERIDTDDLRCAPGHEIIFGLFKCESDSETALALIEPNKNAARGFYIMQRLNAFSISLVEKSTVATFQNSLLLEDTIEARKIHYSYAALLNIFREKGPFPEEVAKIVIGYTLDDSAEQKNNNEVSGVSLFSVSPIREDIHEMIYNRSVELNIPLPDDFHSYTCITSHVMMFDPVAAIPCNHLYESKAIQDWRRQLKTKQKEGEDCWCPGCGESIETLVRKRGFKKEIAEFLTRVQVQLKHDIQDQPESKLNIERRFIISLCQNFLACGNHESITRSRHRDFDKQAVLQAALRDRAPMYTAEISCCSIS